jgi:hypothetical protein
VYLLLLLLLFHRCYAPAYSPSLPFPSTQPFCTAPHTITIANHHSTTNTITVPITSKPTTSSCAQSSCA